MVEKKELFDYLRNRQKAAEIEAKVNGINLWVLLGAIAVVTWQLLSRPSGGAWEHPELILRAILCAEALYLLSVFVGSTARRRREEVRFSQWNLAEMESPFLVLLEGALLLAPPVFWLLRYGISWSSATLGAWGLIFVIVSILAIVSRILTPKVAKEKFPEPNFGLTNRGDAIGDLLFGAVFILGVVEQAATIWQRREILNIELAQHLTLVATLYLLFVVAVQRKLQSNNITWTYELETDLLLETISPDVAIRRIEHRGLGPRLQDVMDRFFDDMDRRLSGLDTRLEECRSKLESAKSVPAEYPAERTSRIQQATQGLTELIDNLASDCTEFGNYLKKLEEKSTGERKAILAPHLTNLRSRHERYSEQIQESKIRLRKVTSI